jgi:hypothetical protein
MRTCPLAVSTGTSATFFGAFLDVFFGAFLAAIFGCCFFLAAVFLTLRLLIVTDSITKAMNPAR